MFRFFAPFYNKIAEYLKKTNGKIWCFTKKYKAYVDTIILAINISNKSVN